MLFVDGLRAHNLIHFGAQRWMAEGCQLGRRWVVNPGSAMVRKAQGVAKAAMARMDDAAARILSSVKGEPLPKTIPEGISMEMLGVLLRVGKVNRVISRAWVAQRCSNLGQASALDLILQASSFTGLPTLFSGLYQARCTLLSADTIRSRSAAALQVMDSIAGLGWFSMTLCEMLYQTGMVGKAALAWMGPLTPVFGVLQMGSGAIDLLSYCDARQLQRSLQEVQMGFSENGEVVLDEANLDKAIAILERSKPNFLRQHFQIDFDPREDLSFARENLNKNSDVAKEAAALLQNLKGRVSATMTHHALAGTATLVGTVALSALYVAPALMLGECLLAVAVVIGFVEAVHHLHQLAFRPERVSEVEGYLEAPIQEPCSTRAVNVLLDRWFGLAI